MVQNKPDQLQVAQTLASIPSQTVTAQDLQRLGVKLDDLQAQGIIGIQQGGRAIKLEDIAAAGGNVHMTAAQAVTAQGVTQVLWKNEVRYLKGTTIINECSVPLV